MRVKEIMTTKVFTVEQHESIDRVFFLISCEKIRHIPVIERHKLVGIVSDRDLYKVLGPKHYTEDTDEPKTRVQNIMRRGVLTTTPDTKISEVAGILAESKVGALPVVENNKLVGIISTADILRLFSRSEAQHKSHTTAAHA